MKFNTHIKSYTTLQEKLCILFTPKRLVVVHDLGYNITTLWYEFAPFGGL